MIRFRKDSIVGQYHPPLLDDQFTLNGLGRQLRASPHTSLRSVPPLSRRALRLHFVPLRVQRQERGWPMRSEAGGEASPKIPRRQILFQLLKAAEAPHRVEEGFNRRAAATDEHHRRA